MSLKPNIVLVAALALSVAGCGKKEVDTLPPAPGPAPIQSQNQGSQTRIVPGSQADFSNRMAGLDTIYFDTDQFDIDDEDAVALRRQAEWLRQYPAKRARIEGYTDERGTREYNLALGERRATAARNYLVSLGIAENRLTVISYGKERPAVLDSTEAAWARNRRAVTLTID
ncbi:peptidoglycan-associated lipoprotein Pal [Altererythrobacter aurantiacus]|uniref:Peptidoglycan-associated lipoprotein n=1 Tax=Parapontixanthobacter aurantiacus TaxID=1463599 RepID=A0A844ZGF7_9SPHN|nr:peptidoglycan-associated lipoprotein Pal [Parapontixanthobacter aurantiacus]MXO86453.1 peptidoglycan-associated lipoprotein Pal [Parapontixanthobacter aurantiacus]